MRCFLILLLILARRTYSSPVLKQNVPHDKEMESWIEMTEEDTSSTVFGTNMDGVREFGERSNSTSLNLPPTPKAFRSIPLALTWIVSTGAGEKPHRRWQRPEVTGQDFDRDAQWISGTVIHHAETSS
jgi:hypothetical protein